ncbi:MAG: polysaccharide biosynthesis tyrosine autokinase [Rhizomicrobium sp.]
MTVQKNTTPSELIVPDEQDGFQITSDPGLSLTDFLRIIRVWRHIILGTAVTVVVLVGIIVTMMTPLYSATAVVMLDERKNNVEDTAAVLSGLTDSQATVQNQVQILTSLELAGRVVDKLKLQQDPEFNPSLSGLSLILKYMNPLAWLAASPKTQADARGQDLEHTKVIHRLLNGLTVAPIGLSTAMKVTFESPNADKAAQIANAIANAYVEDQLEAKFEATQKATQWLSGRIGDLSHEAQAADSAVQQYKAEHNITTTANGLSVIDQQIADINSQLTLAKTDLAEKQSNYGRLYTLAKTGRAADSAQVMASLVIGALRAQESALNGQMADLSTKYGPRHPKMLDLEAQKEALDAKIAEEVQRVVDSAKNDVEVAQSHVSSLTQSLQQLESQGAGQNQAEVQLTALQSAATSTRAMYEAFLGRLNQTQGQEGIQTPDARIISNAEVPQSPSFPNKMLAIGISIPAGLILGLMFAFAAERMNLGFRTTAQLEALLGVPVISTIPEIASSDKTPINAADLVVDKPTSSFTEAVRGLQLGLTLTNVDNPPKVVVVTSSVPDEGKTTIALSLARVAARSGLKTIIVDGDLRRPSLAKTIGKNEFQRGLVEALTNEYPLDQCISKDTRTDAFVLPCLHTPASAADLLASNAMQQLIAKLRIVFDLVIIDSAPVLPINDTKILGRLVDTVLFVVRWEKTPREAAVTALRALADAHVNVAGIAFARADSERYSYYNYGYHSYYHYEKYYHE